LGPAEKVASAHDDGGLDPGVVDATDLFGQVADALHINAVVLSALEGLAAKFEEYPAEDRFAAGL